MKKILLIALVVNVFTAKAQYFQNLYGTATMDEHGTAGVNTTGASPAGQFMTGVTLSCLPFNTLPAVYTDMNGFAGPSPFFQENYIMSNPLGVPVNVNGLPQAMELITCPGILGVVAGYTDVSVGAPSNSGVIFMHLLAGGVPGPIFNFTPVAGSGYTVTDVMGVKKSVIFPGDWYLTGTVRDPNGVLKPFAIRFNECSGGMLWSQIYDFGTTVGDVRARDIEENIMQPFGFPGAAIVGQAINGGLGDGYLLHIDATNGLPAPHPVIFYGGPNSTEDMRNIRQVPNGNFGAGFILCGNTDINGNTDFMVIRMDPVIAPFFTNIFDYSVLPGTPNYCYDAIYRLNSVCRDEYYVSGDARNGLFGGADIMVVKMDQFGNAVAGGEFIYGGPGNDFSVEMSERTTAPCTPPLPNIDGLGIFGSTNNSFPGLGGADLYMIKAYFNGVSGCNEKFNPPLQLPGLNPMPIMPAITVNTMAAGASMIANPYTLIQVNQCFNPTIAGGSNARVAPKEDGSTAILVKPNPAEMAGNDVSLVVESPVEGPVNIEIFDMLGKQYYSHTHTVVKGKNNLPIDLKATQMATGMYSVKMSNATESKTVILVVE